MDLNYQCLHFLSLGISGRMVSRLILLSTAYIQCALYGWVC